MMHVASRERMRGFGLVEILVAMLIGMFGVLIMTQVLTVSEEQKRTTTTGNDAMNEGVLALYAVQSDIRMAGYGISDPKILGCGLTLRAGVVLGALAPVVLNSANITGADANTDTVLVFGSNNFNTPQGVPVTAAGNVVQTPTAFAVNDWVVYAPAVRPAPCNLAVDRVSNVAAGVVTLASGSAMAAGGTLFNLGQSYRVQGYAIRNRNLTTCDYTNAGVDCSTAANWNAIANNIPSMRAQYGRDTTAPAMDAIVDIYDQSTPNAALTPNTLCAWSRISAVRLVLVARSAQMERNPVTAAAPSWDGAIADNPPGSVTAPIVLTGDGDWQSYRYRSFESLVPIRNMAWMGVVTGC